MSRYRMLVVLIVLALVLGAFGCDTGGGGIGGLGGSKSAGIPEAFLPDDAAAVDLEVAADGGGIGVSTGDAYAAVYVPEGAAEAGSTWRVTPLAEAPAGADKALCPGVYVDTAGAEPSDWCSIGFSLPGTAPEGATIVRLAEDGTVAEVVATQRMDYGERTFLTAYVDGFSAYTTSEEDQAARDQAFVDQAQKKGQTPDWTIKVIGTETQENQGWVFTYDLDLFASGAGVGMGGTYKGTGLLSMTGKYSESFGGIVQGLGDISGGIRDQNVEFVLVDMQLASLLTGGSEGQPVTCGTGELNEGGFGGLNIYASGPDVSGEYHSGPVEGTEPLRFDIKVTTNEDVQIEILNVGIFPGKILRTTK